MGNFISFLFKNKTKKLICAFFKKKKKFVSFILAFASPSLNHYKDRHYNFGFCFLFSTATLISTCHLLTTSTVHDWDYIVTAITFTLALIATTTPQPFHPRDLSHESYEAFEVKNGTVYRNVSDL